MVIKTISTKVQNSKDEQVSTIRYMVQE